ncbi:MAG: hypothetical protein HY690_05210 [Chloroflexi bacterium]|nr:hypothetical protein [Chloroflexota bacterium]
MATNGNGKSETLAGMVEVVNRAGLKVAGRWLHFSPSHAVPRPERGQQVRVEVDGGQIRALALVDPTEAEPPAGDPEQPARRLALLAAAATFLAGREAAKSGDVVTVARSWERWVLDAE